MDRQPDGEGGGVDAGAVTRGAPGGGLRLLALEFLPWRGWQRSLLAVAAAFSIAVGLAFALAFSD